MTKDELLEATLNNESMRIINTGWRSGNPGPRGLPGPDYFKKMSRKDLIEELMRFQRGDMKDALELCSWRNDFNAMVDEQVKVQLEAITSDKRAQEVLKEVRHEILCTQGVTII